MTRVFEMFCGLGGSSRSAAHTGTIIAGGIDAWSPATKVFADTSPTPAKPAANGILGPALGDKSPLDNGRRAPATLVRAARAVAALGPDNVRRLRGVARFRGAARAVAALGPDKPFLIVHYGNNGAGGWQSLTVPLRTITTLDRFGLCDPSRDGPTLRMLQVPEFARAMGFTDDLILTRGSRRDRIKPLGNGVCPAVMEAAVTAIGRRHGHIGGPAGAGERR